MGGQLPEMPRNKVICQGSRLIAFDGSGPVCRKWKCVGKPTLLYVTLATETVAQKQKIKKKVQKRISNCQAQVECSERIGNM
jgi:hypothetical protein